MTSPALAAAAQALAFCQQRCDGDGFLRGEFPMFLRGAVEREDHNFLSGYALLHVACALSYGALPAGVSKDLRGVLTRAEDLPAQYQSAGGTANWYAGTPSPPGTERFRGPHRFPWSGEALHLQDDYDDTAVCALLADVAGLRVRTPFSATSFARAAYRPARDLLAPKSQRRLALTHCGAGVYTSWALGEGDPVPPSLDGVVVRAIPGHNSVELTTVANVATAARRLGSMGEEQEESRHFVNRLTRLAVEKLLEGDASYLDFASSYYPRVPFAPIGFVLRDHVLSEHWLLEESTLALLRRALLEVSPHAAWRRQGFANPMYWLHAAAWYLAIGTGESEALAGRVTEVAAEVLRVFESHGDWPDIEFFHGAHLGDYSGVPYARALALETLAMLAKAGLP